MISMAWAVPRPPAEVHGECMKVHGKFVLHIYVFEHLPKLFIYYVGGEVYNNFGTHYDNHSKPPIFLTVPWLAKLEFLIIKIKLDRTTKSVNTVCDITSISAIDITM